MFSFLKKNPLKKKEKEYYALLEKASQAQRSGDIKLYAVLSGRAEELWKEIESMQEGS